MLYRIREAVLDLHWNVTSFFHDRIWALREAHKTYQEALGYLDSCREQAAQHYQQENR